jgi:hypothetical protein
MSAETMRSAIVVIEKTDTAIDVSGVSLELIMKLPYALEPAAGIESIDSYVEIPPTASSHDVYILIG